ncbi:MAG: hypothetical protein WA919_26585 [Coleofasciculaceae cyanobacterium]
MNLPTVQTTSAPTFLGEIFPLFISEPNFACFQLNPRIKQEDGNRLSFHFSRNLQRIVVIWEKGYFYALSKPKNPIPSLEEWQDILEDIQEKLSDYSDRCYSIELVSHLPATPDTISKLAFQVLRQNRFTSPNVIPPKNNVVVKRELDFWAETIELKSGLKPALSLTIRSNISSQGNLEQLYRQNPEQPLIGLRVRDVELGSSGTIIQLPGTVGQHRDKLIRKATLERSKDALRNAPDNQPLVTVEFKNGKQCDYPLMLLRPIVTTETSDMFGVEYGQLLKKTKISHKERQELITSYKEAVQNALADYGFWCYITAHYKHLAYQCHYLALIVWHTCA